MLLLSSGGSDSSVRLHFEREHLKIGDQWRRRWIVVRDTRRVVACLRQSARTVAKLSLLVAGPLILKPDLNYTAINLMPNNTIDVEKNLVL